MTIMPLSIELQKASQSFAAGNFGLWFNKLIPVNEDDDYRACDERGKVTDVIQFYKKQYDQIRKSTTLKALLDKKHAMQQAFCDNYRLAGARILEIKATLITPMITGIGRTHPNEVGMTFDHTLGIPYLPATGIKGLVRLGHILNLIDDRERAASLIQGDELNDNDPASLIPSLFGGNRSGGAGRSGKELEKYRGKVVFLDAYPENVPVLAADIMNPHYGDYYGDETNGTPPADYLDPVPVKFLTVAKGETFIFRAVLTMDEKLNAPLAEAFTTALTEQGFGAKTSVGYGRFKLHKQPSVRGAENEASGQSENTAPSCEIWSDVYLTYSPGNQEVIATAQGKKASYFGKEIIPETIGQNFFKKKKARVTEVKVEPVGNAYRIVSITK